MEGTEEPFRKLTEMNRFELARLPEYQPAGGRLENVRNGQIDLLPDAVGTPFPYHHGAVVKVAHALPRAFSDAENFDAQLFPLQDDRTERVGHIVYVDAGKLIPPYFTKEVYLSGIASGMYVVRFETEKERLTKKIIVR